MGDEDLPHWKGMPYYSTMLMTRRNGERVEDHEHVEADAFMGMESMQQLMERSRVYHELRAHVRDAILHEGEDMHMYHLRRVGKPERQGYLVETVAADARRDLCRTLASAEPSMDFLSSGLIVMYITSASEGASLNCFIPVLLADFEDEGMLMRFWWWGGAGEPPARLVTLDGTRPPAPFEFANCFQRMIILPRGAADREHLRGIGAVETTHNYRRLVCAIEHNVDVHAMRREGRMSPMCQFTLAVAACVHLSYRCWACERLVSGRTKCSVCRCALYCNKACQVADWPRHRSQCVARSP